MKQFTIILFLLFAAVQLQAQNLAIGGQTGFSAYTGRVSSLNIPIGASFEWAFNAKHAIGGNINASIGIRKTDFNIFYAEPNYKYYLVGESLKGYYIGGYFGLGGLKGSSYLSFGFNTGYSMLLKPNFNLEAQVQVGYVSLAGFNTSHLQITPTIGLRYLF